MTFAVPTTTAPMEAKLAAALPTGDGWQFEPKWDGFRCLAFKDGGEVALMSKSGKPLDRFFPEVAALVGRLCAPRFVVDGELIITVDGAMSFDALQARLHPAASRIARLARETPAQLMLFDALAVGDDIVLDAPLSARRAALEALVAGEPALRLSPATIDPAAAAAWLATSGGALDGIVAKRTGDPYRPGERAMIKVKPIRSADCVVGGFRREAGGNLVGSLLLGLFDAGGALHHVGFTSGIRDTERAALTARLEPLIGTSAFTGKSPGGPSRWNRDGDTTWLPLRPDLVVEVGYDQVTADRFRHGTALRRWRPDKAARQCTFDQLAPPLRPAEIEAIVAAQ